MPTLEDTVDFKVVTLNDLLDADVRTGVPVAADDKYKRWAYLSTGAAGMLLIALIVALVTGGGSDNGGTKSTKAITPPPNTVPISVSTSTLEPGVEVGATVSILDSDGKVVASGGKVLQITEAKSQFGKGTTKTISVAVGPNEAGPVNAAETSGHMKVVAGTLPKATTTTSAPPATTPVPIQPAPATTPHS
jgi:hypothetical protein